jgi:hypothetical protein
MSSQAPGNTTSIAEITNVSAHGFWLFSAGQEVFLPYEEFPWFKDVPLKSILNVEEIRPGHFYWPDIDVDLTREIIENPQNYPLHAKVK